MVLEDEVADKGRPNYDDHVVQSVQAKVNKHEEFRQRE